MMTGKRKWERILSGAAELLESFIVSGNFLGL